MANSASVLVPFWSLSTHNRDRLVHYTEEGKALNAVLFSVL